MSHSTDYVILGTILRVRRPKKQRHRTQGCRAMASQPGRRPVPPGAAH